MAGVTSGSLSPGGGYQGRSLSFSWSLKRQDIAGNYSIISCALAAVGGSAEYYYHHSEKLWVYGAWRHYNTTNTKRYKGNIITFDLQITHDANGVGSFGAELYGAIYYSSQNVSGSDAWRLPDIPRVSDLSVNKTSVPADGKTTVTATATKKATSFTDVLTVSLGSYSKTITSGTAFTIPMSWINAISGTSAKATVKVETFNGSTSIGSKTAELTITVPESVVPVINDVGITEAVVAVTNAFGNRFVQNLSQLNVDVDASGVYGSTIKSYSVTLDGVNYIQQAFTSNVIKTAGTLDIKVKITDSRNRTAEDTFEVTVVEYIKPTITSMVYIHCDSDGTQNSRGTSTKVTIAGKVYPVANQNTKALKLKYKAMADASYTERVVTLSDWTFSVDVIVNNTDPRVTYEYIAELTDKINASTPETFRVTTGVPVLSRLAGGKGVTMFGEAKDEGFIVEGSKPSSFTGSMFVAIDEETTSLCEQTLGADILDYMYPNGEIPEIATDEGIRYLIDCIYYVGKVITADSADFNPNTAYPWQTWERYGNGRVLVGVDESDSDFASAGLELGEKKHTITVSESPWRTSGAEASGYGLTSSGVFRDRVVVSKGTEEQQGMSLLQPSITVYRWRRTA